MSWFSTITKKGNCSFVITFLGRTILELIMEEVIFTMGSDEIISGVTFWEIRRQVMAR